MSNIIIGNVAPYPGGFGILCHYSSPTITSNVISGNFGDGIECYSSPSATISNNTISGNVSCGIYSFFPSPSIVNRL